jgi:hypothetical protein
MVAFGPPPAWTAADNNLLVANGEPDGDAVNSSALAAGTLYLSKLSIRNPVLISDLWFGLATAGTGTSTGSFAGLYSSSGALLSGSSDIASQLTGTAGGIEIPLTTPQLITSGFVWAAIMSNLSSSQPLLSRGQGGSLPNLNLTAANFRFAINGTLLSALPASITPSSNAGTGGINLWAGAS